MDDNYCILIYHYASKVVDEIAYLAPGDRDRRMFTYTYPTFAYVAAARNPDYLSTKVNVPLSMAQEYVNNSKMLAPETRFVIAGKAELWEALVCHRLASLVQ